MVEMGLPFRVLLGPLLGSVYRDGELWSARAKDWLTKGYSMVVSRGLGDSEAWRMGESTGGSSFLARFTRRGF